MLVGKYFYELEGNMKNKGIVYAFLAYGGWALISIYWKQINPGIDAVQITSHRIFWSFFTLLIMLAFTSGYGGLINQLRTKKQLWTFALAAILLTSNWTLYIYAVISGRIIETSLGYFINPLVNVLIGVIFFNEKMRRLQWLAVAVASVGVLYLTIALKAVPIIPLGLALTFGLYGLVKKKVQADSIVGLTLETGFMFLPAIIILLFAESNVEAANQSFITAELGDQILLVGTGLITTIPLIWFANAVKSVPLSTIGFIQYLTPTITFLIGLLVYHESFQPIKLIGYSIVWIGVLIFILDNLRNKVWIRRSKS